MYETMRFICGGFIMNLSYCDELCFFGLVPVYMLYVFCFASVIGVLGGSPFYMYLKWKYPEIQISEYKPMTLDERLNFDTSKSEG